jgi:hypothetical protein
VIWTVAPWNCAESGSLVAMPESTATAPSPSVYESAVSVVSRTGASLIAVMQICFVAGNESPPASFTVNATSLVADGSSLARFRKLTLRSAAW